MPERILFEQTLQTTHAWLSDVMHELGVDDRHKACDRIRASLHALRDRLTVEEAAHLGAQLPLLLRGVDYEGWKPAGKPVKDRSQEEFLQREEEDLADPTIPPELAARAVLAVLSKHVSEGEVEDVRRTLPTHIRELWH